MKDQPYNPNGQPAEHPRRRRHGIRRFFRWLFIIILCLALAFLAVRFGPNLYRRFFGDGNTTWVSERFGENLKETNELKVYEVTLTGQETVSQTAWVLGKVQEVMVPYSFQLTFAVDMNLASVSADLARDVIQVRLPSPAPASYKLTVDEKKIYKYDWLYPLTPERYAEILGEIEQKLYDECVANQDYRDAAWQSAVANLEKLFADVAATSKDGVTCTIEVTLDDTLGQPETSAEPSASPAASPAA